MSNGIFIRQNEDNSIAMLAAQRQLYRDIKKYNNISISLSLWVPFILAIATLFIPRDTELKYATYILSIVAWLFALFIDKYIKENKELAAFIQQKFDIYVYKMPWNEKVFKKNKNISNDIAIYSKKILSNPREKEKLKNWYTYIADERELTEGILMCQRENVSWDSGLRKRVKFASIILFVLLLVLVFVIGLLKNERVIDLISRIAFILPMLKWLLDTVTKLDKDIKKLKELDFIINDNEPKTMEELQEIQKEIYQHRKGCCTIPEYIYNIFKDNDEDRAYRQAMMEKK